MDSINFRIRLIRKHFCNDSNKEFAKIMGKKENVVNNWVREGYSVGRGVANEIANKFGVSINWIIPPSGYTYKSDTIVLQGNQNIHQEGANISSVHGGVGQVAGGVGKVETHYHDYKGTNIGGNHNVVGNVAGGKVSIQQGGRNININGNNNSAIENKFHDERRPQPGEEGIPLIPVEAMACYGTGETQIMLHDCERFVVPTFKGAEFLISVKGSSMYPKYSSGDIVACKKISADTFFQWNKVYVLDTEQGALIKRIEPGKDDDHLLIVSENPKYQPFQLHKSHINSVALVIGVIRLE